MDLSDFLIVYASEQVEYDKLDEYDDLKSLFVSESVLERILDLQDFILEQVEKQKITLSRQLVPDIEMGPQCTNPYPCDFMGYCSGARSRK